jgi:tetratricopeptide (TPR) repeat protein
MKLPPEWQNNQHARTSMGALQPSLIRRRGLAWLLAFASLLFPTFAQELGASASPKPSAKPTAQSIVQTYRLVGDFTLKEETRPNSDFLFWRYPYPFPKRSFAFHNLSLQEAERLIPPIKGTGRALEHYHIGRLQFLKGDYMAAKTTWIAAKSKYGLDVEFDRWLDLLIGISFTQMLSDPTFAVKTPMTDNDRKSIMANASQFLSIALLVKKDRVDANVDRLAPMQFYNMAVHYYRAERLAAAYGAASSGLEYLAGQNRTEFRLQLRELQAETFISAQNYQEAASELDKAIRADAKPEQIGPIFNRIGDIYFDLNNFDLAEEVYQYGAQVADDLLDVNVQSLILRAESLFWLGRFPEARRIFEYALEAYLDSEAYRDIDPLMLAFARLRYADVLLALNEREEAVLAYFKVSHAYPEGLAAQYAHIQRACLELPVFAGNNLSHGRELLDSFFNKAADPHLNPDAIELAYFCHVSSFAERERNEGMLDRIRAFQGRYPQSRFLQNFHIPAAETQRAKFYAHFHEGDLYNASSFFEKNRELLFQELDHETKEILFNIYMTLKNRKRATEFLPAAHRSTRLNTKINLGLYLSESEDLHTSWGEENQNLSQYFTKQTLNLGPVELSDDKFVRFLSSDGAKVHQSWLYTLAKVRAQDSQEYLCSVQFPLLAKAGERDGMSINTADEIEQILAKHFPLLLKDNPGCALSILGLERKANGKEKKILASRYLTRDAWEDATGGWATMIYTLSEDLQADPSALPLARQLWQRLTDPKFAKFPEARFSAQRLDTRKTELEQLWGD